MKAMNNGAKLTGKEANKRAQRIIPPIPDTPENVARAIMQGPPKGKWEFLKKTGAPKPKTKAGEGA